MPLGAASGTVLASCTVMKDDRFLSEEDARPTEGLMIGAAVGAATWVALWVTVKLLTS